MTLGYEEIPPDSESLLESQRAYGYPAEAAIADIVDNCITANSKNIDIHFGWDKRNSFLFISNDGEEMDENQLTQAMRLGAKNPKDKRNIGDLGRWGMGLKTASLSQAKKITIFSVNNSKKKYISRCWDLDFIAKEANGRWFLINTLDENSLKLIRRKFKYKAGTVILWENLDRMLDLTDPKKSNFTKLQEKTINHLQLVFHRFLDKKHPNKVNISLNGKKLKPFDPFLESDKATQPSPAVTISDKIKVKGFVLPHVDKFENSDKYEEAGGPKGWNEQQGFYVYREDRLIVGGSWLNLGTGNSEWKKDIHFKLARIKIDLDNSLDEEWKIDVMKVSCQVPARYMNDLKEYAKTIRAKAEEVFRNRARGGPRPRKPNVNDSIWKQKKSKEISFVIDRNNELIKSIFANAGSRKKDVNILLKLIEEALPLQDLYIEVSNKDKQMRLPLQEESQDKLIQMISELYNLQLKNGKTKNEAIKILRTEALFKNHLAILEATIEDIKNG